MRQQLSGKMRDQLIGYHTDLQSRYGDPRVQAMQQQQEEQRQAEVEYDRARRVQNNLRDAYDKQAKKNREEHATRRERRGQRKPPGSARAQPRTAAPRP